MTTNDIESHFQELYGIDVSNSTISRITDQGVAYLKEWQERPIEDIYAVVFLMPYISTYEARGEYLKGSLHSFRYRYGWQKRYFRNVCGRK